MRIERVTSDGVALHERALAVLLQECSADSGLGFVPPLALDEARAYWRGVAVDVAAGRRVVLVCHDAPFGVVGSAQLALASSSNGRHRAQAQKIMVAPAERRRGLARGLLAALEEEARREGRSTLVLDTWAGGDAEALYARAGWTRVGEIPAFAQRPDGKLAATAVYYKLIEREMPR